MMSARRHIPVLAVLPPHLLLLDLAGPLEVLRIAGALQDQVTFEISYASPRDGARCSIGLDLAGVRVALVHDLLERTGFSMEQVAERAGFSSARHMRRIWQHYHAHPPSKSRNSATPAQEA